MRRISIALSGGGIRASIFHLGVLKYLAEIGELDHIAHISSVSGASLAIGLIYAHSDNRWPYNSEYIKNYPAQIKRLYFKSQHPKNCPATPVPQSLESRSKGESACEGHQRRLEHLRKHL